MLNVHTRATPLVEGNITHFMELSNRAHVHSCRAEALEAFNMLVRTDVPAALRASSMRAQPYTFFATLVIANVHELDKFAACLYSGMYSFQSACVVLSEIIVEIAVVLPLTLRMSAKMAEKWLILEGPVEWIYTLSTVLLTLCCYCCMYIPLAWLSLKAQTSNSFLIPYLCASAFLVALAIYVFHPRFQSRRPLLKSVWVGRANLAASTS